MSSSEDEDYAPELAPFASAAAGLKSAFASQLEANLDGKKTARCPLCSALVVCGKGEIADVAMSAHIERGCAEPAGGSGSDMEDDDSPPQPPVTAAVAAGKKKKAGQRQAVAGTELPLAARGASLVRTEQRNLGRFGTVSVGYGASVEDRGSVFSARVAWPVENMAKAEAAIAMLRGLAQADHNMVAYRTRDGGKICRRYDDDGEAKGGQAISGALNACKGMHVAVCVSRWWGGTNLGKARFTHIRERTTTLLYDLGCKPNEGIARSWGGGQAVGAFGGTSFASDRTGDEHARPAGGLGGRSAADMARGSGGARSSSSGSGGGASGNRGGAASMVKVGRKAGGSPSSKRRRQEGSAAAAAPAPPGAASTSPDDRRAMMLAAAERRASSSQQSEANQGAGGAAGEGEEEEDDEELQKAVALSMAGSADAPVVAGAAATAAAADDDSELDSEEEAQLALAIELSSRGMRDDPIVLYI